MAKFLKLVFPITIEFTDNMNFTATTPYMADVKFLWPSPDSIMHSMDYYPPVLSRARLWGGKVEIKNKPDWFSSISATWIIYSYSGSPPLNEYIYPHPFSNISVRTKYSWPDAYDGYYTYSWRDLYLSEWRMNFFPSSGAAAGTIQFDHTTIYMFEDDDTNYDTWQADSRLQGYISDLYDDWVITEENGEPTRLDYPALHPSTNSPLGDLWVASKEPVPGVEGLRFLELTYHLTLNWDANGNLSVSTDIPEAFVATNHLYIKATAQYHEVWMVINTSIAQCPFQCRMWIDSGYYDLMQTLNRIYPVFYVYRAKTGSGQLAFSPQTFDNERYSASRLNTGLRDDQPYLVRPYNYAVEARVVLNHGSGGTMPTQAGTAVVTIGIVFAFTSEQDDRFDSLLSLYPTHLLPYEYLRNTVPYRIDFADLHESEAAPIVEARRYYTAGKAAIKRWQIRRASFLAPEVWELVEDLGPKLRTVRIEANGDFEYQVGDPYVEFNTEGEPWMAVLTQSQKLYVKQVAADINTAQLLDTDVEDVTLCRGWKSDRYGVDAGLIVVYRKQKNVLMRRYLENNGVMYWSAAETLLTNDDCTRIEVKRLNDFRMGIYVNNPNRLLVTEQFYN